MTGSSDGQTSNAFVDLLDFIRTNEDQVRMYNSCESFPVNHLHHLSKIFVIRNKIAIW